jgi:cytochrome b561
LNWTAVVAVSVHVASAFKQHRHHRNDTLRRILLLPRRF